VIIRQRQKAKEYACEVKAKNVLIEDLRNSLKDKNKDVKTVRREQLSHIESLQDDIARLKTNESEYKSILKEQSQFMVEFQKELTSGISAHAQQIKEAREAEAKSSKRAEELEAMLQEHKTDSLLRIQSFERAIKERDAWAEVFENDKNRKISNLKEELYSNKKSIEDLRLSLEREKSKNKHQSDKFEKAMKAKNDEISLLNERIEAIVPKELELLKRERNIEPREKKCQQTEALMRSMVSSFKAQETNLEARETQVIGLLNVLESKNKTITDTNATVRHYQVALARRDNTVESQKVEISKQEASLKDANTKLRGLQYELKRAEEKDVVIEQQKAEITRQKSTLKLANEKLGELEVTITNIEQDKAKLVNDNAELQSSFTTLNQKYKKLAISVGVFEEEGDSSEEDSKSSKSKTKNKGGWFRCFGGMLCGRKSRPKKDQAEGLQNSAPGTSTST
uniref:Uncharacterized protein n=2 Tax=Clytia hemisphaerica TaxID=252671 RepID=A0A7M5X6T9_9CNID